MGQTLEEKTIHQLISFYQPTVTASCLQETKYATSITTDELRGEKAGVNWTEYTCRAFFLNISIHRL